MIKVSRLLSIHGEDLERGKFLDEHQRRLWKKFEGNYNGFLVIVRGNARKEFAFYVPH